VFSVRVLHQGVVGRSRVTNFITIPVLGSVQAIGSITVTEVCSTPFSAKEREGGDTALYSPGEQIPYVITVGNPTSHPLEDVVATDIATYKVAHPTGGPDDEVEVTQVIPIGRLEARSYIEIPILLTAPTTFYGTIHNRVSVASGSSNPVLFTDTLPCQIRGNCPPPPPLPPENEPDPPVITSCAQSPPPAGCITQPSPAVVVPVAPFITELVLAPQQDWNDSAGGNGRAFDAVPGNGTVDGNDVWVEVVATTGTASWTITLTDATGATFSQVVGAPAPGPFVKVVSGFNVGASPVVRVDVIDQLGLTRQSIDVTGVENVVGAVSGVSNESLTWSIYGSPTPLLQQLLRRAATIGTFSPF
jgi:hypothetical protein